MDSWVFTAAGILLGNFLGRMTRSEGISERVQIQAPKVPAREVWVTTSGINRAVLGS